MDLVHDDHRHSPRSPSTVAVPDATRRTSGTQAAPGAPRDEAPRGHLLSRDVPQERLRIESAFTRTLDAGCVRLSSVTASRRRAGSSGPLRSATPASGRRGELLPAAALPPPRARQTPGPRVGGRRTSLRLRGAACPTAFLEGEEDEDRAAAFRDRLRATATPGPDLRRDVEDDGDSRFREPPGEREVEIGRVDEDRAVCASAPASSTSWRITRRARRIFPTASTSPRPRAPSGGGKPHPRAAQPSPPTPKTSSEASSRAARPRARRRAGRRDLAGHEEELQSGHRPEEPRDRDRSAHQREPEPREHRLSRRGLVAEQERHEPGEKSRQDDEEDEVIARSACPRALTASSRARARKRRAPGGDS